jgi:imidazoleglycerol phosphate synthase glutamine amidotransferase subunit HisH
LNVTLIDSPVANTANIARALRFAGAALHVTADAREIAGAEKLVLPGVGSFSAAMEWLRSHEIDAAIREAVAEGAFLLGICVGHQLLFDVSHEHGTTAGLGLVRGEVQRVDGPLPVPQIGWNRVSWLRAPVAAGVPRAAPLPIPLPPPGERGFVDRAERGVSPLSPGGGRGIGRGAALGTPVPTEPSHEIGDLFTGIPPNTSFYFVNSYAVRCAEDEIASAEYNGRFTAAVQHGRVCGVQFHPEKSSSAGLRVLRNFIAWT